MNISAQENSFKINPSDTTDNSDLIAQVAQSQNPAIATIMTEEEDDNADTDTLFLFICCASILSGLFE